MRKLNVVLLVGLTLGSPSFGVSQEATVSHTFQAGTPARASEVNENFSVLVDAINAKADQGPPGPPGPQGEPGTDAATILDFSMVPVVIDTPGYYVLDRDWDLRGGGNPLLQIDADDVTVDFRGFGLLDNDGITVWIFGAGVTLRNGRIEGIGQGVLVEGDDVVIHGMHIESFESYAILLFGGLNAVVRNSWLRSGAESITLIVDGGEAIIRGNYISGGPGFEAGALSVAAANANISDNSIFCNGTVSCVRLSAAGGNVFANNTLRTGEPEETTLLLVQDGNLVINNVLVGVRSEGGGMWVQGTGNLIEGNKITSGGDLLWGIRFDQDGNLYGNNKVAGDIPFDLQGTVQVDLGGNVGL